MARRTDKTRVTLSEVAAEAGISAAAASLALRGKPGVAESTRQRVLDVASDLGYTARARSDRGAEGTIGVLVKSRPADVAATNAFYGPVVAGVMDACAESGIEVRVDAMKVDVQFNPIEPPRMAASNDLDGLLVLGAYVTDRSAELLTGQPVVLVDGYAEVAGTFPSVVNDNTGGAAEATRCVIEAGHRRIAFVGIPDDPFPSIRDRFEGYSQAITAAGLSPTTIDVAHNRPEDCASAVVDLLRDDPEVTALVCANDTVALEVHAALGDLVPSAVSIVGFDDIDAASRVRPALASVSVDQVAMGRLAVGLLRHRMSAPADPVFTAIQQATVVLRDSLAPAPSAEA